jgi:hypothetical protein
MWFDDRPPCREIGGDLLDQLLGHRTHEVVAGAEVLIRGRCG